VSSGVDMACDAVRRRPRRRFSAHRSGPATTGAPPPGEEVQSWHGRGTAGDAPARSPQWTTKYIAGA